MGLGATNWAYRELGAGAVRWPARAQSSAGTQDRVPSPRVRRKTSEAEAPTVQTKEDQFHETWCGEVQPSQGLMFSVPVLCDAGVMAKLSPAAAQIFVDRVVPQLLKPGGQLVYATCTVHPAENGGLIDCFLAKHPLWRLATSWQCWPGSEGDGFFAALLQAP